jgi:adenine-specific DNA methylase
MVGNPIHRKTEHTIIKKINNGWQPNTQKNTQYNYKKRQTMVGNIIHRKTDNNVANHCLSFFIIVLSVFLCIRLPTIVCLFYNCIFCFSVY